jgi:DNA recombination protein RmuC
MAIDLAANGLWLGITAVVALAFGWLCSFVRYQKIVHQQDVLLTQKESAAQALQQRLTERDQELDVRTDDLHDVQNRYQQLLQQHTALQTSLDEKQQAFETQLKQLRENRELLKLEFEHLANDIFERKGMAFKELNQESIVQLLAPVQQEMQGFRLKVESIHTEELKQRSELKAELVHLQTLNRQITDQADKLTNALQGQKKIQGNWGELLLENVLDHAGLRPGIDYQREVSINTEEGRKRPDVVVYLPQNKHLIIDAKTSLAAYTRYVNADDELARQQALIDHVQAVMARINELAERNYDKLPGIHSPEVVIMFVPIESAYVEALKYQPALYQQALDKNVLVATPTTLLTSLNIVRQLWRFEDQNKHTAELASRAERFYSKLSAFLSSLQEVGKQLDKARGSYDKAFAQLYSGKGNLIKQAAEFKDLGVAVQKSLPEELVEKAQLELPDIADGEHLVGDGEYHELT